MTDQEIIDFLKSQPYFPNELRDFDQWQTPDQQERFIGYLKKDAEIDASIETDIDFWAESKLDPKAGEK